MQLIDVAYQNLHEQISAIDRLYMAPELLKSEPAVSQKNRHHDKADTYSLGAILYILITGGKLDSINEPEIFQFREAAWRQVSEEL